MIVINLTIIITSGDPYRELRIAQEHDTVLQQAERDAYRATAHRIGCRCGWENWYTTPGRAKMGLSGHKRWCRSGETVT